MPSLIPGFEYDIFISYRQKDNKGDRWVSEFVEVLKTELESTFKEEINVYFDINPHDGLLETHDVDESLKEKLKCLIFIPIISRTYCDPKSFAWGHEFRAFVDQASQDQFGLKIKLPNGNVASRVLPIRIHDLDIADVKLCEDVLGGVLRGVEFIYKEPGVNRSLTPDDDDKTNLNKTKYRNQINKVALAINEIIQGLKTEPEWARLKKRIDSNIESRDEKTEKSGKQFNRNLILLFAVAAILVGAAIILYPRLFRRDTLDKLRASGERISVAVLPFKNMTNDTTKKYWQELIQNNLITSLSNSEELQVRQTETINDYFKSKGITDYASITPSIANTISKKLNTDVFVLGSINRVDTIVRINSQLIDTKTKVVIKSFQIEGSAENILNLSNSISATVKDFLLISRLEKEHVGFKNDISTGSAEAFRYYIFGRDTFGEGKWNTALDWFKKALVIDTNFIAAIRYTCYCYRNLGNDKEAKKWCLKLRSKKDMMDINEQLLADFQYAVQFETPMIANRYAQELLKLDDQSPYHWIAGWNFTRYNQYDKAISEYERVFEIYDKWGSKVFSPLLYTYLGLSYHQTGQFKKEKKLYTRAERDFPDNPDIISRQAILALTLKDEDKANQYIEKYKSVLEGNSTPEVNIIYRIAFIYNEAGILDKAEEYFRQVYSLLPENFMVLNNFAWFLIDKDRNINEGLELFEKARKYNLDEFNYMDGKGYGLLKQEKYKEALDCLQKAWELKLEYNHETYLHLEAAKKAVAEQERTER